MYDFSLLIKKLQISTSLGENENKSKFNAEGIKLPPKGTLVKGQSALYWLWAANQTMGKKPQRGSGFIFKSTNGIIKNISAPSKKMDCSYNRGKSLSPSFQGG